MRRVKKDDNDDEHHSDGNNNDCVMMMIKLYQEIASESACDQDKMRGSRHCSFHVGLL